MMAKAKRAMLVLTEIWPRFCHCCLIIDIQIKLLGSNQIIIISHIIAKSLVLDSSQTQMQMHSNIFG